MNKRTLVLCASVGALLLSATAFRKPSGPAPESRQPSGPTASGMSGPSSVLSRQACTPRAVARTRRAIGARPPSLLSERPADAIRPPEGGASLELLRAAYSRQPSGPNALGAPSQKPPGAPVEVGEPTLWLARAIYSETKLPHEQELVAWVVRNRVETNYREQSTYREVVLAPYQFSAFNPGSSKRRFLMDLTPDTELAGWQQALWVAYYVRHADPVYRPFSIETRHFYSERSMRGRRTPYWAEGSQFVSPGWNYLIDERRFRFYEQIS